MLKSKKIITLILGAVMIGIFCSTSAFAATITDKATNNSKDANKPYVIVVKGKDNIEAYKKAGMIRTFNGEVLGNDTLVEKGTIITMGTQPPTAIWDLNKGSRSFTYNMSTYVYSNYAYIPNAVALDFWHLITPNSYQRLKLQCYKKSNNALFGTFDDYIDDDTYIGFGGMDIGEKYYFKYSSPNGNWISGSGVVY